MPFEVLLRTRVVPEGKTKFTFQVGNTAGRIFMTKKILRPERARKNSARLCLQMWTLERRDCRFPCTCKFFCNRRSEAISLTKRRIAALAHGMVQALQVSLSASIEREMNEAQSFNC
jgi:hypothetical protein